MAATHNTGVAQTHAFRAWSSGNCSSVLKRKKLVQRLHQAGSPFCVPVLGGCCSAAYLFTVTTGFFNESEAP